jgi:hypothetical protein
MARRVGRGGVESLRQRPDFITGGQSVRQPAFNRIKTVSKRDPF